MELFIGVSDSLVPKLLGITGSVALFVYQVIGGSRNPAEDHIQANWKEEFRM